MKRLPGRFAGRFLKGVLVLFLALGMAAANAQETVCAKVKIEIKQQMTLERQGFDAEMTINNALETASLSDVSVIVKVTEENGMPVLVTADPHDTSAKFFVRLTGMQGISDLSGNGAVPPKSTAVANWLLIPAPGAAGASPLGKKYLVGATLQYKFAGEMHTLDVAPAVITVKPMPLITLDYFLTKDVQADNPLTPAIEPVVPFTLGVRVKNTGAAVARNLKIDSVQPVIVDNEQGLAITFKLTGSYLNDAPAQNTLLMNFGDIAANSSKVGRWVMESSLAGRFVDFTARFSHADELGGAVTSLMQATNAHLLIHDVRVDLPGRDVVRDFLAKDGDTTRVFESEGLDTTVQDLSAVASLTAGAGGAPYRLTLPATLGFVYARLPDPFRGAMALTKMTRADGKAIAAENVWLSRTMNADTKDWDYWISVFDANTNGIYDAEFTAPPAAALPPVIQFIPDRTVAEGKQVSFLVEASSPAGKPVVLSAAPLPSGARFLTQSADPTLARAAFDWTPSVGQAGSYLIVYTASDGLLSATRSATIKVEVDAPPPGPGTPTIDAPVSGAQVPSMSPVLAVVTGSNPKDPTTLVQFEIYSDEAMSLLATSGSVNKGGTTGNTGTTSFTPPTLQDNTWYWWRARAYDGSNLYSPWVNGRFFVNLFNDPPDTFNLSTPASGAEVAEATPRLTWTNSADKDGDAIAYRAEVFPDATLANPVAKVDGLAPGDGGSPSGSTSWTTDLPLTNHATYYWRVTAKDANGAETATPARPFVVNTGNTAPTVPAIVVPIPGGQSTATMAALTVQNSTDAEGDPIMYVFEIDIVNTFDSGAKANSGPVPQAAGANTSWTVSNLVENQRYWWRVKAQDGRAESDWTVGNFLMNAVNDLPPMPTVRNPGNAAWSATQMPTFQANPVLDPEGEPVSYRYEIYRDASLSTLFTGGVSTTGSWMVPTPLNDKTTYWWRMRAEDPQGGVSVWTSPTVLYVSTGPYQDPTIQVTSPAVPMAPDASKKVTIRWEGVDPNIEPKVGLYYGTTNTGYAGTNIVDGLAQASGAQSGSYVWDVSALAPGAYYVYALIYDPKGVGRAYAPGAVVVPTQPQTGGIDVHPERTIHLHGDRSESFSVRLTVPPSRDVVVPLSLSTSRGASISPASLTFTPTNWKKHQSVTVRGGDDCSRSRTRYQVLIGKAQSLDPNYIGVSGHPVDIVEHRSGRKIQTTNDESIHICHLTPVSQRKLGNRQWEYTFAAELTNVGQAVSGVRATAQWIRPPFEHVFGMQILDNTLVFGAVGADETVKSTDTITVRTRFPLQQEVLGDSLWLRWNVVKQ